MELEFFGADFHRGFTILSSGSGPVWVCPHSGPSIETVTSRDDNSDTVASRCWLKTGGTLIISGISRKMTYGVDFNRNIPPKDVALNLFDEFFTHILSSRLERYRKEYAWSARNSTDYKTRSNIYNDFWKAVERSGNVVVFVHRQFTRMKNYPSLMDIITYQGEGVNKKIVETVVGNINKKYERFFKKIWSYYKDYIIMEERRIIEVIKEKFGEFDINRLKIEYRKNILKDIEISKKYAEMKIIKEFENNPNERNFLKLIKSALKNGPHPIITVESVFKGSRAMRMKKPMFLKKDHVVLEVESTAFFNYWFPDKAADILIDLLGHLVSIDAYKKMGAKQTQILKFIKG